jgi:uncharacterized membrane protein
MSDAPPAGFDALLRPHRSLGPRGFWLLMAFVSAVCFTAGVVFTSLGAWPVFGFLGLDVLAIYVAFRINYRQARLFETLSLDGQCLEVRRVHPSGRVEAWSLSPNWLSVEVEGYEGSARGSVRLRSHGREVRIARFLTPGERQDLAAALRDALRRWRLPEHLTVGANLSS